MQGFPLSARILTKYIDSNHKCVAYKLECGWFNKIGLKESKICTLSRKEFKEKILNNELVCTEVSITKDNRMIDTSKAQEILYLNEKDRESINMTSKLLKEYREEVKKRVKHEQKRREADIGHSGNSLLMKSYDPVIDKMITDSVIEILSDDKIVLNIIDKVLK